MANEVIKGMGFHHIALRCKDINKSLEMYKALGLKEVVRWGEGEKLVVMCDLGDGGRIEFFANASDEYSPMGKWNHFAVCVDDVDFAYETALKAGFKPMTPPKIAPLDSYPEKITLNVAFVLGPDDEQLEFFKMI